MELKPNIYYKTILQYREAELLFEALKLDIEVLQPLHYSVVIA